MSAGLPAALRGVPERFTPILGTGNEAPLDLLRATALMFVAYTGYGRIATLGEEVADPRRTIPRAIVLTLVVSALLYVAVAAVAVGSAGADGLAAATYGRAAPLAEVTGKFTLPGIRLFVAFGAVTAMLGVLLNLVLGLSRVVLAMARRGDLPSQLARVDSTGTRPGPAVILTGLVVGCLTFLGSVKVAWSFSAFAVLVYYAITNLAALRLAEQDRLYPRAIAVAGLAACLSLAFFVEPVVWAAGLTILAVGLAWHVFLRRAVGR